MPEYDSNVLASQNVTVGNTERSRSQWWYYGNAERALQGLDYNQQQILIQHFEQNKINYGEAGASTLLPAISAQNYQAMQQQQQQANPLTTTATWNVPSQKQTTTIARKTSAGAIPTAQEIQDVKSGVTKTQTIQTVSAYQPPQISSEKISIELPQRQVTAKEITEREAGIIQPTTLVMPIAKKEKIREDVFGFKLPKEELTASDITRLEAGQILGKPTLEGLLGLRPYFVKAPKEELGLVLFPDYEREIEKTLKQLKENVFWEDSDLADYEKHPESFDSILGEEKIIGEPVAGIPYFEMREGKLFEITPYSQKVEQKQSFILKPNIKEEFEKWNAGANWLSFADVKLKEKFAREEQIQSYLSIKETGFSPQRLGIEREKFKVARGRYPSDAELAFFVKGTAALEAKHWGDLYTAGFLGLGGLGGAGAKGVISVAGALLMQEVVTEKARGAQLQLDLPKIPNLQFYPYSGVVENVGFWKLGVEESAQVAGGVAGLVGGYGIFKSLQKAETVLPTFVPTGETFFNPAGYWNKGKLVEVELKASFVEQRQAFDVGTTIQVGKGKEYGFFGIRKISDIEAKSVFEAGFNLPESENQAINRIENFLVKNNKVSLDGIPQSSQVSRSLGKVDVGNKTDMLYNIEVATPTKEMIVEDLSKADKKWFLPPEIEILRYQSTSQTKGILFLGKELEEKSKGYFTAGKTNLLLEQTTQELAPTYLQRTGVGKVSSFFGGQVDEFKLYSLKGKGKFAGFVEEAGKKIGENVNLNVLTKAELERASLRTESFGLDVAEFLGRKTPKGIGGKMRFIAKRPNELLMDLEGQKNPKFYEGGRPKGRTKADILAENEQLAKLEPQFKAMRKASVKKVPLIEKAVLGGENTIYDDVKVLTKRASLVLKRKPISYKITTNIIGVREEFPLIEKPKVFGSKMGFTSAERLSNKGRRNLNEFLKTQQKVSEAVQKQAAITKFNLSKKIEGFEKVEARTNALNSFIGGIAKTKQRMRERLISFDEEESVFESKLMPKTISRNELRQQNKQFNFYSTKEINKSIQKSSSKEIGKTIDKTAEKEISKVFSKEISKPVLKPIEKNIEKSIDKSITKNVSKTLEKQVEKQISKVLTKTIERPVAKPMIRLISKPAFFPKLKGSFLDKKGSLKQGFQAFVRKRGKFRPVGKPAVYGKAFSTGIQRVTGSAARTFTVKPTRMLIEESEDFPQPNLPVNVFKTRKGKQGLLFIERTGKTIKSKREYYDIRYPKDRMLTGKTKGGYLNAL